MKQTTFKNYLITLSILLGVGLTVVASVKTDDYSLLAAQGTALVTLGAGLLNPSGDKDETQ